MDGGRMAAGTSKIYVPSPLMNVGADATLG